MKALKAAVFGFACAAALFASSANALIITGASALSSKGPPSNLLSRTVEEIFNDGDATIVQTVLISDDEFTPSVGQILSAASGTFAGAQGSTVTFSWYIDRANVVSTLLPLPPTAELVDTFTLLASEALQSFSHNAAESLIPVIGSPFSMTLRMDLSLVAGGRLLALSQTETAPVIDAQQIPEPGVLALLGIAVAGLALTKRNRA